MTGFFVQEWRYHNVSEECQVQAKERKEADPPVCQNDTLTPLPCIFSLKIQWTTDTHNPVSQCFYIKRSSVACPKNMAFVQRKE